MLVISSLWLSQRRTVEITPVIFFSSSLYLSLSLSSCEFCPRISSETAGQIFANKVSYERSPWGVVPSLIFIGLTGLILSYCQKCGKNLAFGFLLRPIPTSAVKLHLPNQQMPHFCSQESLALSTYIFTTNFPCRQASLFFSSIWSPIGFKAISRSTSYRAQNFVLLMCFQ